MTMSLNDPASAELCLCTNRSCCAPTSDKPPLQRPSSIDGQAQNESYRERVRERPSQAQTASGRTPVHRPGPQRLGEAHTLSAEPGEAQGSLTGRRFKERFGQRPCEARPLFGRERVQQRPDMCEILTFCCWIAMNHTLVRALWLSFLLIRVIDYLFQVAVSQNSSTLMLV
ncbi:uncharacterized protein LOC110833802 [Zootermopsis nevadensis]|uniref:uncharacterized protein LOC110833802 n=1 Tax=Zootermopsis nevadensis TaxID=136037 RepID=UPI000B8E6AF8|nr:uncharacterized protein LOC110833802 [Zootermopsis nevadensis]